MQINNPFQMNDWEIKNFLKVILAVQLALWGVIALDALGLQIPILRQFIGFIYLTFVPGIIILRILKLHKLGNIETLLYTVGLSIATLMFTGLFMNTLYPLFGISGPISITPLIITISVVVLVLCVLSYIRDRDFSEPSFIDVKDILSPPALFLCLIPFLAIFGTYLVNFYHNNIILMFLIVIIALIVILIAFDKFIPKNLYPLAVFVIAISLLYHGWLISMYIWGTDVHIEYYFSNLVIINSHWNLAIPSNYNGMLSIAMVAPIYSNILNMDLTWVYKIIYPFLFSMVPLGLYHVFRRQTDDKIAFLSCFFFASLFFYIVWLIPLKQQIAELFLVLLILLMINKDMNKIKRSFLFIVFGVSLTVSHYGTSYIYMFCLISVWLILALMDYPTIQRLRNNIYSKFSRYNNKEFTTNSVASNTKDRTISSTFVLLFIVFTLTWYMYVSSSSAFNSIVRIGDHIAGSIFTEFLNPEAAQGLHLLLIGPESLLGHIHKIIHLVTQFFIAIGVLTLLLKHNKMGFEREYTAFSIINFMICLACFALPYFSSALYTQRLYHITLIFLAPFCVIGGITVLKVVSRVVSVSWTNHYVKNSLRILSIFFVIFLLFTTGFVDEVVKSHRPESIPLSQERIKSFHLNVFEQDVYGSKWLSKNTKDCTIYSGRIARHPLGSYGDFDWVELKNRGMLSNTTAKVESGAYIYLNYQNVVNRMLRDIKYVKYDLTEITSFLNTTNKIYSNGGNEIYHG